MKLLPIVGLLVLWTPPIIVGQLDSTRLSSPYVSCLAVLQEVYFQNPYLPCNPNGTFFNASTPNGCCDFWDDASCRLEAARNASKCTTARFLLESFSIGHREVHTQSVCDPVANNCSIPFEANEAVAQLVHDFRAVYKRLLKHYRCTIRVHGPVFSCMEPLESLMDIESNSGLLKATFCAGEWNFYNCISDLLLNEQDCSEARDDIEKALGEIQGNILENGCTPPADGGSQSRELVRWLLSMSILLSSLACTQKVMVWMWWMQ